MERIRTAIVGVGNCASALLQGLCHYRASGGPPEAVYTVRQSLAGFDLKSIEFVAAFDVSSLKVGMDLAEAIFLQPNCADRIAQPPSTGVRVLRGPLLDGLERRVRESVPVDPSATPVDVRNCLLEAQADVLVNLLPSGAREATYAYVEAALAAGVAVVNAIPVPVANDLAIAQRAMEARIPIIGDDIKSQVGATVIHRVLADLFPLRSATIDHTFQFDWGGDMDFCNLTSDARYDDGKRQTKTEAVVWQQPNKDAINARITAVDYIPFLKNTKEAYIRIEGRIFGERRVRLDVFLTVPDSFNSAGVLVDAIRLAKWAKDRKRGGVFTEASACLCKRPPTQLGDHDAYRLLWDLLK